MELSEILDGNSETCQSLKLTDADEDIRTRPTGEQGGHIFCFANNKFPDS
jgi:hypothetical protein